MTFVSCYEEGDGMAGGRPKAALVVTNAERETLEQWARRPGPAWRGSRFWHR